jgi:hypothetical protein
MTIVHLDEALAEVEIRSRVASILGTAAERRALRQDLGLSIRWVARATGLSLRSVQLREDPSWTMQYGSLESPEGLAYIRLIEALRKGHVDARRAA